MKASEWLAGLQQVMGNIPRTGHSWEDYYPMGKYIITVDKYDKADTPEATVIIECHTRYALLDDLAEWVTEEIDAEATVVRRENVTESEDDWEDTDDS